MKISDSLRNRCNRWLQTALMVSVLCLATTTGRAIPVGYVNTVMTNGYNFVVNPLIASPNNRITNVLSSVPEGTRVWLWNTTSQSFDPPSIYDPWEYGGWSSNLLLSLGRGFVLHTSTKFTNTFVGEVAIGYSTNFIAGSNKLTLIGNILPLAGALTSLNFPGGDGDNVMVYPFLEDQYLDSCTFFSGHGWFDPQSVIGTNGPAIALGQSFFIRHKGADVNWIQVLNPLVVNQFAVGGSSSGPPPPDIVGLTIQNGQATLRISETNRHFNVQFSTDRVFWTTIATNQIGGTWTGPCPSSAAGFLQLVSP